MPDNVSLTSTNTGASGVTGGGTTPVVKKVDIKEIFKVGLTRSQAEQYGAEALQMFDTYNKEDANGNKDDVIDETEFRAYQKGELGIEDDAETQDIKGKTRTAPGGVYTVVKGDTLSKIANDFGLSIVALYNANRSVIGNNMNLIEVGMKLQLKGLSSSTTTTTTTTTTSTTGRQTNPTTVDSSGTTISTDTDANEIKDVISGYFKTQMSKTPPQLFAGMTRTQAEKRGGETLRLFNQYAGESADKIDNSAYRKYARTLDIKPADTMISEITAELGKKGKIMTAREMGVALSTMVEEGSIATGIGRTEAGRETSGKVQEMILRHNTAIGEQATKEEVAEAASKLMQDIKASAQEEIDKKGSLYRTHYDRLKRGEFTEFERACGLQPGDELTEEQIIKLTETAVKAEHIYPVLKTLAQAVQEQSSDGSSDNRIMLLIMDLGDQFFENEDVLAIAQMTGLMAVVNQAKQQFAANHIAETSTLSVEDMSTEAAALYTATLADKADASSFQVFAENNSESIDFINKVVNQVIQNSDNEDKNNALREVMTTVNNKVGYTDGTTPSNRGNSSSSYTTSEIRRESDSYYASMGITNPTTAEEIERQDSHRSVNKLKGEEGPEPVVYNPARIRQLARDYNNSIGKFDTLSPEDQAEVRKYLEKAMGQPQAIISIMLAGNDNVQMFLLKEKYITIEDIARNVKSFPSNFDSFSDTIKDALNQTVKESVMAGTLKPEQMTDGERKMYEYSEQS